MTVERYFKSAKSLFFRWDNDGSVLCWDDGVTIAFAEELAAVVRRLGPEGLPPLNSIAVLLSACRNNWPDARKHLMLYDPPRSDQPGGVIRKPDRFEADQLLAIRTELDRLHSIAKQTKTSLTDRCELAAMVFEGRPSQWGESQAEEIAVRLTAGLPIDLQSTGGIEAQLVGYRNAAADDHFFQQLKYRKDKNSLQPLSEIRKSVTQMVRDLFWLRDSLPDITAEELKRRVATGIEEEVLPIPDQEEEDEPPTVREMLRQLVNDTELGGIARLAQNLFAVVHFPRALTQEEDLPLGGVSDITNRGQLDRLLLSELAHDDLTLAVRVAVNEAMYFRRESPPTSRSQTRKVLIDSGLYLWGIPRIFATSAALAIAATGDRVLQVDVWRGEGDAIQPVDFHSKQGLEEHLAAIVEPLHCGEALEPFVETPDLNLADDETEFVIITSEDATRDSEFQRQLADVCLGRTVFVITVNRNGRLEFSSRSIRGKKVIREVQLDLKDVLADRKSGKQTSLRRERSEAYPAIMLRDEFPIRLPHTVIDGAIFEFDGNSLSFTRDGRAMLWTAEKQGALQLSDQIGTGKPHWQGWDEHGLPMVVFGHLTANGLRIITIDTDDPIGVSKLEFTDRPVGVTGYGGQVFVIFKDHVEAFVPGNPTPVGKTAIPNGLRHSSKLPQYSSQQFSRQPTSLQSAFSRFFVQAGSVWFAVAPGEHGPDFVKVPTKDWPVDRRHL